jgi:beta-aspartyl-dipeptidase (metallo-type)
MLFIKNGDLYSPKHWGIRDILVVNEKITGIFPSGTLSEGSPMETSLRAIEPGLTVLDADGCQIFPGIVDRHVHFNGAGGEGGPAFRTPPLQLSSFIKAGVTSAVGMLGTDGACRSLRELLMKARGLEEEGISSWILTGSYGIPPVTLTGGVTDDLCLIDKVIGLKMALSDHRSSHPSVEEIRRLVSDARRGGILSGKSGVVCVHMGSERTSLSPLLEALEGTDVPPAQFAPTHVARAKALLEDAAGFGKRGGCVDLTADLEEDGEPEKNEKKEPSPRISTREAIKYLLKAGVPPGRITLSSDGNGSMPRFDSSGRLAGMGIGPISAVLGTILELWEDPELDREALLGMGTSHAAGQLGLKNKGSVEKGMDADILVLKNGRLRDVVAKGRLMMRDKIPLRWGTFETPQL